MCLLRNEILVWYFLLNEVFCTWQCLSDFLINSSELLALVLIDSWYLWLLIRRQVFRNKLCMTSWTTIASVKCSPLSPTFLSIANRLWSTSFSFDWQPLDPSISINADIFFCDRLDFSSRRTISITGRTTRQHRPNREPITRRRERRRLLALAATDFIRTTAPRRGVCQFVITPMDSEELSREKNCFVTNTWSHDTLWKKKVAWGTGKAFKKVQLLMNPCPRLWNVEKTSANTFSNTCENRRKNVFHTVFCIVHQSLQPLKGSLSVANAWTLFDRFFHWINGSKIIVFRAWATQNIKNKRNKQSRRNYRTIRANSEHFCCELLSNPTEKFVTYHSTAEYSPWMELPS